MKKKKETLYPASDSDVPSVLNDAIAIDASVAMIRTQVYLSRDEHLFLQAESRRSGTTMAGLIRRFIDEKMSVPEDAWTHNSLLSPPADPEFNGPEDGVLNHDHYISGTPKKWVSEGGRWVEAPPLPENHHAQP